MSYYKKNQYFIMYIFSYIFFKKLAHNVPAVCDGLTARISKPQVSRAGKLCRNEAWERAVGDRPSRM